MQKLISNNRYLFALSNVSVSYVRKIRIHINNFKLFIDGSLGTNVYIPDRFILDSGKEDRTFTSENCQKFYGRSNHTFDTWSSIVFPLEKTDLYFSQLKNLLCDHQSINKLWTMSQEKFSCCIDYVNNDKIYQTLLSIQSLIEEPDLLDFTQSLLTIFSLGSRKGLVIWCDSDLWKT